MRAYNVDCFTADGLYMYRGTSGADLFMKRETKSGFMNIYPGGTKRGGGMIYDTPEAARREADNAVASAVPVTWEE